MTDLQVVPEFVNQLLNVIEEWSMGADKKYSGVSNESSDLALQLLQALRQRFPDHFKERESQLHLVDVFPGQTEEEALTMYMKSHPDAMESDVFIFSWVTGVDDEDIYARGGNSTTPVFRDLEIAEMVRELEQAPPVQAPPVESDPDARPASLKGVPNSSWGEQREAGWKFSIMLLNHYMMCMFGCEMD